MKQIKTKPTSRTPRELPRAKRIPREVNRQVQAAAAHSPPLQETPERYATEQIEQSAERTMRSAGQKMTGKAKQQIRRAVRGSRNRSSFSMPKSDAYRAGKHRTQDGAKTARQTSRNVQSTAQTTRKSVQSAKQTAKGTVKTVRKTVKSAKHTVKAGKRTVKTAQRTVKTAARTAKASARAAKVAAKAAKAAAQAAAKVAKLAAKAVAAAVKATIAAIKALVAAIAAGGWVAVVVILVVALILLILGSAFGIFFSDEAEEGVPVGQAVAQINASHQARIDAKIDALSTGEHDEIKVVYDGDIDGDSNAVNNWTDVLTVFAVKYMGESVQVFSITPEMADELKNVFFDMNKLSAYTETKTTETTDIDENGERVTATHTTLIIHITVTSLSYEQGAAMYGFTDEQMVMADEMMSPAYYTLFAELLGVDLLGGADLTKIISNLPVGTQGAEVVKAALTKVGAPYVLGAKGDTRFDCSGLVYWSISQVDPELGAHFYTSAGYQCKYCIDNGYIVGRDEAVAGDLVFWQKPKCTCGKKWREIHHVGIYLGDGMIVDASSSNGHVIVRELFDGATYKVYAFARPYSD